MPTKKELAKYLFFVTALTVAALILWPFDSAPEATAPTQNLTRPAPIEPVAWAKPVQQPVQQPWAPPVKTEVGTFRSDPSKDIAPPSIAPPSIAPKKGISHPLPTDSENTDRKSGIEQADYIVRIKNHDRTAAFVAASTLKDQARNSEARVRNTDNSKAGQIAAISTNRAIINRADAPESITSISTGLEPDADRDVTALSNATGLHPGSRSYNAFENQDWNPTTASTGNNFGTEFNKAHAIANHSAHETSGNHNPVVPVAGISFDPPVAQSSGPSQAPQGTTSYRLADQPKHGDHYKAEIPLIDCNAHQIETFLHDFSPDPVVADYPYDPYSNQNIYQCKQLNANQRPLLEIGRPWYQLGQLSPGSSILGFHNNVNPQFLIFGDYRQAYASNRSNGDSTSQLAFELNTIWNLFITSTERVVWGTAPFDNGAANTHYNFERDSFEVETDFDIDFGYFEGDLGAIVGGFVGKTLPFDAPFAVGLTPILIQNGIWLNDAVEGLFFTIPARNSARLGISNMDISFGFVWDEINSAAFADDKNAAKAYLIYTFIEALNGYLEIDYAFLEDRNLVDRSYHNISMAYSRRFGNFISHSTRVIANAGQQVSSGPQTADGVLLLLENSLITSNPYTVVPYFNMFAGFDTPQSVAGNQQLIATGILFESDGMTNYPTLDPRGSDTLGGAIGLNLLAQDFSQQLILEAAAVFRGDDSDLAGDQYGLGIRHQIPLNNSWILRSDAMYGFLRGTDDATGARIELRKKF